VLTVVVLAVTAATSVAGLLVPGVLLGLRRDAAWSPTVRSGAR
jgi:hypothetical protein